MHVEQGCTRPTIPTFDVEVGVDARKDFRALTFEEAGAVLGELKTLVREMLAGLDYQHECGRNPWSMRPGFPLPSSLYRVFRGHRRI
jgi:hypothetical protein